MAGPGGTRGVISVLEVLRQVQLSCQAQGSLIFVHISLIQYWEQSHRSGRMLLSIRARCFRLHACIIYGKNEGLLGFVPIAGIWHPTHIIVELRARPLLLCSGRQGNTTTHQIVNSHAGE
jgi:hypothetical protein